MVLLWLLALVGLQVLVGVWAARSIRSEDDFLVAGRRLGLFLATTSIFATWFGAESCVGAAGAAYEQGFTPTSTEPFAYGAGLVLMGVWFASQLWSRRITTLADFFAQRFGLSTERFAACLLLPSSLLWAAAQVRAFGHVVAVNSDGWFTVESATALAAVVAVAYTVTGGLLADVYTDVVQGIMLLVGLVILGVATWQALPAGSNLPPPPTPAPSTIASILEAWAIPICGSIVAQEALSRSLAAASARTARNAAILGGLVYIVVGLMPLGMGLVGSRLLPGLEDGESILPELSLRLLPQALNLMFAAALVSAILSTVDSCLLVVASTVTHNLWPAASESANPAGPLRRARCVVVVAGIAAFVLASTSLDVKQLVEEASGFASAGVFVLAVMGTHTTLGGRVAANSSLLAGLLTWLIGRHACNGMIDHPYLTSLAAAAAAYAGGTAWESLRRRRLPT